MPSFLETVKNRYGTTEPVATVHHLPPRDYGGNISPYAAAALNRELSDMANALPGGRNHQLNKSAFSLSQLIAGGELPHALVHEQLTQAALAAGLTATEITATLRSGLKAGSEHPRETPPPTPLPDVTTIQPPTEATGEEGDTEQDREDAVRNYFPIVDWETLWADTTEEEWIIEPILPARRLVALYSPPKTGKSLLMLEMAAAVANGTEVLGVTPDRPRRVLYVDFENDPKGDIRERLQAMGHTPQTLTNLCYLSFPNLSALDSENGSLELIAAIETYACEVVVVDTVSRAVKGEENENDTWLNFYRHTGLKLKQHGIALIRLDHTGKDEQKGQRGGSAKGGDVDAVWRMSTVVKDETYRLDCEMNRMPIAEKTVVLHRHVIPNLHHKVDGAGRQAAFNAQTTHLLAAMDSLGLPKDTGRPAAADALRAAGFKVNNKVLSQAIKIRKNEAMIPEPTTLDGTE
jgi:hypothetical protein